MSLEFLCILYKPRIFFFIYIYTDIVFHVINISIEFDKNFDKIQEPNSFISLIKKRKKKKFFIKKKSNDTGD